MQAGKQTKTISVRLPESQVRQIKTLAASRGITLQEAVHQALKAWASPLLPRQAEPLEFLEGSLAGVDVFQIMREQKEHERQKDSRRP